MAEDIEIEIFGQVFRVAAGEATPAYIQRLAYYVDEKMRAIASATKTMPLNRMGRVPVARVLTGLVVAFRLAVGRGMSGPRRRSKRRRLVLALFAVELGTIAVAFVLDRGAGSSLSGPGTNVVAAFVALGLLRMVLPASLWRFHGAEHKAVAAYESDCDVADVDAVLGYSRVHPHCGTNLAVA